MLKPALLRANIKKQITPHGLRHTFASLLLQLGKPMIEVQAYLGHADPLITARVYSHFIEDPEKPKSPDVLESGVIQQLEI